MALALVCHSHIEAAQDRKVILFLLDGVRWDYFKPDHSGFQRIIKDGVKAEYLESMYPSLSAPNHYSISTGKLF